MPMRLGTPLEKRVCSARRRCLIRNRRREESGSTVYIRCERLKAATCMRERRCDVAFSKRTSDLQLG